MNSVQNKKLHLEAIDGLRFLCAMWVVFSHTSFPFPESLKIIKSAVTLATNGAWSVTIFFVISGLCIHLPYVTGKTLDLKSFYLARFSRIVLPMAAALLFAMQFEGGFGSLEGVLWSLYCEVAYYAMYPFLLKAFHKFGVLKCIVATAIPAAILTLFPDKHLGLFWCYGFWGSTLLGLPIWLTGCLLAEKIHYHVKETQVLSKTKLFYFRSSIFLAGIITMILGFHSPFKYKHTFLLLTPLIFYWLFEELKQTTLSPVLRMTKPLGVASYSIYLTHKLCLPIFAFFALTPDKNWLHLGLYLFCSLAFCGVFYTLIEKPSHNLAKFFAAQQKASAAPAFQKEKIVS